MSVENNKRVLYDSQKSISNNFLLIVCAINTQVIYRIIFNIKYPEKVFTKQWKYFCF